MRSSEYSSEYTDEILRKANSSENTDEYPRIYYSCWRAVGDFKNSEERAVAVAYTEKDPGRRYFTCNNVVDGATHIWKWWDDAVMEEMRDFQTEIRRLKEAVAEREKKLLLLEKTVYDAGKDTTRVKLMVCLLVVIGLVILVLHGVASKASMGEFNPSTSEPLLLFPNRTFQPKHYQAQT
ncbi:hypothetical protein DY000_02043170 [Brassica cretica]|uniref:Zinc finger GRF-type domain-containing protein n=1 Tax=Brassica cretica TaxID=69181 RepID=A0ABQ7BB64_BRACR|nr:hypothetical protein DY000_02043170 [Brassica cretica]